MLEESEEEVTVLIGMGSPEEAGGSHQQKERMDKREVGAERKQATNFKEAVCCPSAIVLGAGRQKKWFV